MSEKENLNSFLFLCLCCGKGKYKDKDIEGGKIMERNWRDQRGNCESLKTKLNNLLSCCFCSEKDKSGRSRRMSK